MGRTNSGATAKEYSLQMILILAKRVSNKDSFSKMKGLKNDGHTVLSEFLIHYLQRFIMNKVQPRIQKWPATSRLLHWLSALLLLVTWCLILLYGNNENPLYS